MSQSGEEGAWLGDVLHSSKQVWCAGRSEPAVVSIIERVDGCTIHFVLWCSLRAGGHCDECCLRAAP